MGRREMRKRRKMRKKRRTDGSGSEHCQFLAPAFPSTGGSGHRRLLVVPRTAAILYAWYSRWFLVLGVPSTGNFQAITPTPTLTPQPRPPSALRTESEGSQVGVKGIVLVSGRCFGTTCAGNVRY